MPIRLDKGLVRRLRLRDALDEELARAQDRLPSRVAEEAVDDHIKEYAARLEARCAAGFAPVPHELVWMPKAHLRYRPLSALPLAERAVFRGLATDMARNLSDLDAYDDTRETFEQDLLDDPREFTHFGLADVTSFYRYVPHTLLHQRLIETTGLADLADAVLAFLRETMQASLGVPQNVGPSDQLADLVIAPIERRLIRHGISVTRFNDDFRIGARSNRAARAGIEMLQSELYAIGLTLNDAKTTILRRETYAEHVDQMAGATYEDVTDIGDEPESDEVLSDTKKLLRSALREPRAGRSRLDESEALNDVRRALRRFTRWSDPYALRHTQAIVNRYPSLTQHFGRYCSKLVEEGHAEEVASRLESSFKRLILTAWQEMWLLEPVIAGAEPVGKQISIWLTGRLTPETPPMLRARAAHAAACVGLLDIDEAKLLVDVLPEAARPDAIRALALVHDQDPAAAQALGGLPDAHLASWIFHS